MEAEHRVQLGLLKAIYEALSREDGRAPAAVLARQLLDYSEVHFLSEQILMREHAYPGYQAHVAEHDHLLDKLRLMTLEWETDGVGVIARRAARIEDWLLLHMRTTDHSLEQYLVELKGGEP